MCRAVQHNGWLSFTGKRACLDKAAPLRLTYNGDANVEMPAALIEPTAQPVVEDMVDEAAPTTAATVPVMVEADDGFIPLAARREARACAPRAWLA